MSVRSILVYRDLFINFVLQFFKIVFKNLSRFDSYYSYNNSIWEKEIRKPNAAKL